MNTPRPSPPRRDFDWAKDRTRRRQKLRRIVMRATVLLAVAGVVCWAIYPAGGDVGRYQRRSFRVMEVSGPINFTIDDGRETAVRLLGVDAPIGPAGDVARAYLQARLAGHTVVLNLDPPHTRDAEGLLSAYVYISDTDLLNAGMLRDGKAFSDRRIRHAFRPQFDQFENEARAQERGIWADMNEQIMPPWRRDHFRGGR